MGRLFVLQEPESRRDSATSNRFEIRNADPGELALHRPDAHFQLIGDQGVTASCSVWWTRTPTWNQHRVGMIGHYHATVPEAALLVNHACRELREQGCTLAVGPMDGSTWRSYRFVTQHGDEPHFFLEPDNPPEWVAHFSQQGFEPLAHYFSAVNDDPASSDSRLERTAARLDALGVTVRAIRQESFADDLRQIYAISRAVFAGNLLYTEMDETEFLEMYQPLLGQAPLDLILLAEHAGLPIGFVFAVPDFLESPGKDAGRLGVFGYRTLVVKTLAALPQRRYAGLGQVLLAKVQQRAAQLGFTRAIHALVRDSTHLRRISGRCARRIREYTLFARTLT